MKLATLGGAAYLFIFYLSCIESRLVLFSSTVMKSGRGLNLLGEGNIRRDCSTLSVSSRYFDGD